MMFLSNKEENCITYEEMDKMLEVIDMLPENVTYEVTIEDLVSHNVEENFREFAPYLLWVSESIAGSNYVKDKEVNRYINALFQKYLVD